MKPVFSVILWNDEKPNFNHTVIFPAYPYALEDILEKVQAKNEASLHWEIDDTVFDLEYLLPISEKSGSIRELNALARKLSELDRVQQIGFLGLLKLEQGTLDAPLPLSRIIDLAYGTQCCHVIPELRSEVELAYHCVEEGLIPEFKDLPQEQLRLINYPLLGEKQRKAEGGVFVQSKSSSMSGYVRQTAPIGHTSLDLTPERPKYAKVNPADTQTLTFYNVPGTTLTLQKLVTGTKDQPLAGVEFLITDSSGAYIGPNQGIYRTDEYGRITLSGLKPGTVITAKETKTVDGFVLDGTPKSIEIKEGEAQTLTFYNAPVGGLELIKVSASDKTKRIPNTTFEIRKMDGGLVETVTTDSTGRVHVDLDAGDYYAVETEAGKGFKIDETPQYFTVKDGETTTLTVTNKALSGIQIHKIDSTTKKGIYGVSFLLYDSTNTPIGQYTSDDQGYVYIEDITEAGRYYLKELENEGYLVDTQMKTVYVKPGEVTLVEWENTAVTGQIQITKTSEDYNSMNGWPAGTPMPGRGVLPPPGRRASGESRVYLQRRLCRRAAPDRHKSGYRPC